MATFNAGAIEATLDLDTDPFQRGIAVARAEGKKFGQETYKAKLDADTTLAARGANNARRSLERAAGTYVANFETRGLAEATAQAAAMEAALGRAGGTRTIGVDASAAATTITRTRRGIMALLPALAILATGLIPITAAVTPVLGLLNSLTLAAAAAGTLIVAFQGIGEAVKATNAAALEPTAENLEKMRAAMSGLSPAAREFVGILTGMKPELEELQNAAAEGFFGQGGNSALRALRDGIPQLRGFIFELSSITGGIAERTVEGLDTDRWRGFLSFVQGEARPGLDALSTSVGSLAGGFAGLWMAFDPLNDDFSDWLVDVTGRFDDWAASLPDNERFIDFIAYVRETGPQVADFLASWGGALMDIVVAAAPLGGTVLDVLTAVGDAVSFIAEQPFGPTILGGLAALYTLNRVLAITNGLLTRAGVQTAGGGLGGMLGGLGQKVSGVRASLPTLSQLGTVLFRAGQGAENASKQTLAARDAVRGFGRTAAVGAAGIAAVAAMTTGVADSAGLANTTMLALTGAMVGGVPGAVAGGIIGAFFDYRASANAARDATKAFTDATSNDFTSVSQFQSAVAALGAEYDAYSSKVVGDSRLGQVGKMLTPTGYMGTMDILLGGYDDSQLGQLEADLKAAWMAAGDLDMAGRQLAKSLGIVSGETAYSKITVDQMDAALTKAQPAMQALGITTQDLADAAASGDLMGMVGRIEAWNQHADTAAGRTKAFADSVADLADDALRTAESAEQMNAALEALLSPTLNLEAATDQWRAALATLAKELKVNAGFEGYTKAAQANREMTRGYVTDSMERLKALAGMSETTEKDMANAVAATRKEFIRSGMAAGFSRKEIAKRADELGLTPKLVRTVFEAAGIDATDLKARQLRESYRQLPKDVQTQIRQEGVPKTMAEVNALVKKYELTEKERQALITLRDQATGPLSNIEAWLKRIDGSTAHAKVIVDQYRGRTVPGVQRAAGGPVIGPGTSTSDSIPAWLSNNEHVWTAREVANAGGHAAVEAIRAQFRYAAGGAVESAGIGAAMRRRVAPGMGSTGRGVSSSDLDRIVDAILASRPVSVTVSSKDDIRAAIAALEAELRKVS